MGIADKLAQINKDKADTNAAAGKSFLVENKKRPGVIETSSGLQYEILLEGNGQKPTAQDSVRCHYHGTTIAGVVFDSSVTRNEPATFPLNRVIKGWTEALQLMGVGSKWNLFLPSEIAYGSQQAGTHIGPHSTLIFEVELLAIV